MNKSKIHIVDNFSINTISFNLYPISLTETENCLKALCKNAKTAGKSLIYDVINPK